MESVPSNATQQHGRNDATTFTSTSYFSISLLSDAQDQAVRTLLVSDAKGQFSLQMQRWAGTNPPGEEKGGKGDDEQPDTVGGL